MAPVRLRGLELLLEHAAERPKVISGDRQDIAAIPEVYPWTFPERLRHREPIDFVLTHRLRHRSQVGDGRLLRDVGGCSEIRWLHDVRIANRIEGPETYRE